jgi:YD repeat-containing protein
VNSAFGEVYTYDGLNQLASFDRGTLNGTKTGITGTVARSQSWGYDALGNWDSVTTDSSTQTRSANAQNEVTSVSGATTPTYDANGNMTQAETGLRFTYDAWNHLVAVKNSAGTTTLETFAYDGLSRRVANMVSSTTTDLYFSAAWQVLEEKVGGNVSARYVWSPVYVDALVLRDRDTDANGTLDERLWAQQDANFNVTALIDGTGGVVERYAYDPFGSVSIYDVNYVARSGGSNYGVTYLFRAGRQDVVTGDYTFGGAGQSYSPTLGRWFGAHSARVNPYLFVDNQPQVKTDESSYNPAFEQKYGLSTGGKDPVPTLRPVAPPPGGPLKVPNVLGRDGSTATLYIDRAHVGTWKRGSEPRIGMYFRLRVDLDADTRKMCDRVMFIQISRSVGVYEGPFGALPTPFTYNIPPDTPTRRERSGWDNPNAPSWGWRVDRPDNATTPYSGGITGAMRPGEQLGDTYYPALWHDTPGATHIPGRMPINTGLEFYTIAMCVCKDKAFPIAYVRWGFYYANENGTEVVRPLVAGSQWEMLG